MIIPNRFIKLDYNPSTDVLYVEWPKVHFNSAPELRHILGQVVEIVKIYDIRRLMADTSTSVPPPDVEYAAVLGELAKDLSATRLERLARLDTGHGNWEKAVKEAAETVQEKIAVRTFSNLEQALKWLSS